MKSTNLFFILIIFCCSIIPSKATTPLPDGNQLLIKIDRNMFSESSISLSRLIIYGRRGQKTLEVKSWSEGDDKSFSEYLAPPRDKGTKMLKLGDQLWIYDPNADRTIQISGHMLRQSVMGSDLSYEDFMEETKLQDAYDAFIIGEVTYQERNCWILELTAKIEDVAYYSRKLWVDQARFLPLKEERYAKSGKLLKTNTVLDVMPLNDRWYPRRVIFKDEMKEGKGTEFIIDHIELNVEIPPFIFTKAALRK